MKNKTTEKRERYEPEYPILDRSIMVPRDQIKLVSEDSLSPIEIAELTNLRRGVEYKGIVADTPKNREAVAFRTAYYQMVAHKEGWVFDPQLYQMRFVDSAHFLLSEPGTQKRIFEFKDKQNETGRIGFLIKGDVATRMADEHADSLATRILRTFWPKRCEN